ncbi:OmpA family protein [Endozoicomonas sp.]|uniref:OmpA family protein n=1 Tax=Endozoicomonas sp. TaxID=1892382 RepID=UPI00383AD7CA
MSSTVTPDLNRCLADGVRVGSQANRPAWFKTAARGQRSLKWFLLLMVAQALTGCVSSETLYARYDQPLCPEQVVMLPPIPEHPQQWHWSVFFAYNRSDLSPEQIARLESNLQWLNHHPDHRVLVRGFTDSIGSQSFNLPLSRRRASAVTDGLMQQGLARDRIEQMWAGKRLLPGASRPADHDEPLNRRVELLPIDLKGQPLPPGQSVLQPAPPTDSRKTQAGLPLDSGVVSPL